jgi:ankyrin repeat protein
MNVLPTATANSHKHDKIQSDTDKAPKEQKQQQPSIDISIDRINKILQSLTPLTQPYTDKEGNTIQLWSSEKRPLFASIKDLDGEVEIVPGRLVKNPLSPSDTEKELHEKLSQGPLRRWDLTVDPKSKKINIWPHLIAAGRDTTLPEDHIWFRHTPFKGMNARQVHDRFISKGFTPKGPDPQSGKGRYINPKSGRSYNIDPKGSGRYKAEPSHVDVYRGPREPLGKRRLAYGNDPASQSTKQFKETVQQTKLTESYNSTHPKGQIAAKGGSGGQIGGVGNQTGIISGLFDGPDALHEDEHYFYIPAPEGKLPFTDDQLQQILRELAQGIFIHETVPFFSLHFNGDSNMFPVIHPAYQNTLVGRTISMLDYHMKGFLNGAFYDEEFIKQWQLDPTQDESILREHVMDLHDYCQKHLGPDAHYFTVSEFIKIFEQEEASPLSFAVSDEPPIFKDYSGFRSSFRIIAKQNHVKKGGNVLTPDSDFDVLYTISPDPAYEDELKRYRMEHGTDPKSYTNLKKAYEAMAHQIKSIMPRLPLFHEYFEMLKVINFFCYYFRSQKEANKLPILESKKADVESMSPYLFPFLPRRKSVQQDVKLTLSDAINKLPQDQADEINQYIRTMKSTPRSIPNRIIDGVAEGYCAYVKDNYTYTLRDQYKHPEYYRETAKSVLSNVIRQSTVLQSEVAQHAEQVIKGLEDRRDTLEKVLKGLDIQRKNLTFIETDLPKALSNAKLSRKTLDLCIADAETKQASLEGTWFKTPLDNENISRTKAYLIKTKEDKRQLDEAISGLEAQKRELTSTKPQTIQSIQELEKAEKELLENIANLEKAQQQIHEVEEDPIAQTIECFADVLSIPGTVIQLFSEQSADEQYQNKRIVGGVGVSLSNQPVTLDPVGSRQLTQCFTDISVAEDGTLVPVTEDDEVKGHLFKLGFVDFFTADDTNYQLLEGTLEGEHQSINSETVAIFYAIQDEEQKTFTQLLKDPKVNLLAKDPNGISLLHYAASSQDPYYLQQLVEKGARLDGVDSFGYSLLHYAAREGHIENVALLLKKIAALKNRKAKNGTTPLYLAVQNGRADIVAALLRSGASVNDVTAYGMTPLYCAIFHENEELALKLMDVGGINVNKATEEGSSPLHLAIELGLANVVKKLITKGASVTAARKDGYTPLHVAARFGKLDSIRAMKETGRLNLNAALKSERTALHLAAEHFHHDTVVYLLSEGANPTKYGWDKETPLMLSMKSGNLLSANFMIEHYGQAAVAGKEVSHPLTRFADYHGQTPMDIAIQYGFLSVIEQLLLKGETLSKEQVLRCCEKIDNTVQIARWINAFEFVPGGKKSYIEKALKNAAINGRNKVVSMLIRKYKAVGDFQDSVGRGLIHYAAKHDHISVINKEIKTKPASLFAKDRNGDTPATIAARSGSVRVLKKILMYLSKENRLDEMANLLAVSVLEAQRKNVEAILRKIQNPNIPLDENGHTALHLAAMVGDVQMVAFLKERGCRFDIRDNDQNTPFHVAVESDWDEVLDYLFDKKNELPVPQDLLYFAAAKGTPAVIKRLVEEQGFSVNESKSLKGDPAIFGCIQEGNFKTFAALVGYGVDPNALSGDQTTALYLSARLGRERFVSVLVNSGASLETKVKGRTPLHIASAYGHYEAVKELALAGCDTRTIDGSGKTAKMLAERYKHHDVMHILSNKASEFEIKKQCVFDAIKNGDVELFTHLIRSAPILPLNNSMSFVVDGTHHHMPILHLVYLFGKKEKKEQLVNSFLQQKGVKNDVKSKSGQTIAHMMAMRGECNPADKDLWLIPDDHGNTPLHFMARLGSKHGMVKMLQAGKFGETIDTPDERGETPLFDAIRGDNIDNVDLLLKAGANPNALTKARLTPLALAATEEKTLIIKSLLKAGVHVDQYCLSSRTTALAVAIQKGQRETAQLLLANGASATCSDANGVSPIMGAAMKGDLKLVRLLHISGGSLRSTDHRGRSVAHFAAQSKCVELIDYLSANGVSFQDKSVQRQAPIIEPKAKVAQGVLPFHIASVTGDIEMMRKLNGLGSNIEAEDDTGDTALLYATLSDNDLCVKFFDHYRLMKDHSQMSKSVAVAVGKDNVPQLKVLIKDDFAIDAPLDPSGMTAIHFAAMLGGAHSLLYLIQQGADITIRTQEGFTAFDLAVKHGQIQTAKLLARYDGVNINVKTLDGSTHIHQACAKGDVQMVGFLLKHQAELNVFDEHGHTPLYVAVKQGNVRLVSLLLAFGADSNKISVKGEKLLNLIPASEVTYRALITKQLVAIAQGAKKGDTRLQRAIRMGDDLSIKFLSNIDDVNEKNEEGDTPLHLAVRLGSESVIYNLLREKADIEGKDLLGRTPLFMAATELHSLKMVNLLISLKADLAAEDGNENTIMQTLIQQPVNAKMRGVFNTFYRAIQPNVPTVVEPEMIELIKTGNISELFRSIHKGYRTKVKNDTWLHHAVKYDQAELACLLIDLFPRLLKVVNDENEHVIDIAVKNSHGEAMAAVLSRMSSEAGEYIIQSYQDGCTEIFDSLHQVIETHEDLIVKLSSAEKLKMLETWFDSAKSRLEILTKWKKIIERCPELDHPPLENLDRVALYQTTKGFEAWIKKHNIAE